MLDKNVLRSQEQQSNKLACKFVTGIKFENKIILRHLIVRKFGLFKVQNAMTSRANFVLMFL